MKWLFLTMFATLAGCSTTASHSGKMPVGRVFPTVRGTSLSGETVVIPDDLAGAPAVLLVAYRRGAQDDIDLWRTFLEENLPHLRWLEVPTIVNPVWRPFSGWIDAGMRGGVPEPLWTHVVTVYSDGPAIEAFLGRSREAVAHVAALDAAGTVTFFHAEGFSESAASRLTEVVVEVSGEQP